VKGPLAARRHAPAPTDLGPPVSYLLLREGTPVFDRRGERIGVVERTLADLQLDIFDGVVIHTEPLPGRHLLASADQVAAMRERGVLLSVAADALRPYRESTPAAEDERPADGTLHAFLRRALDRLGGRGGSGRAGA
jgi:hypothetical protein